MSGKHNRTTSTLQKGLKNAVNEMDSSNAFRAAFSTHLPNSKTSSPFKVDGLLEDEFSDVRSLLEFKSCSMSTARCSISARLLT